MTPRSWLFVPADKPVMVAKALASGADAVIVDLEDAVLAPNKEAARNLLADHAKVAASAPSQLWIRINPLQTPEGLIDLASVVAERPTGIVLPKVESFSTVIELHERLSVLEGESGITNNPIGILPIAGETPKSVFGFGSYNSTCPRLLGLTWGPEDLSAAVGAASSRLEDGSLTPLCQLIRSLCLVGVAAAEVPAIETIYPAFRDIEGLGAFALKARQEGFRGMLAIHPRQVPVINEIFSPTTAEIEHAKLVIAAVDTNSGTASLDGKMLDAPHLKQAKRVLEFSKSRQV